FILSLGSLYQHGTRANSLTDYQSLAQLIIPMIGPGDVIVVENTWWAAPIHYYLKPTRFQVVDPGALVDVLHSSSTDGGSPRVWVLAFGAEENRTAQIRKLAGEMVAYSEARRVEARGGEAVLFERRRATSLRPWEPGQNRSGYQSVSLGRVVLPARMIGLLDLGRRESVEVTREIKEEYSLGIEFLREERSPGSFFPIVPNILFEIDEHRHSPAATCGHNRLPQQQTRHVLG